MLRTLVLTLDHDAGWQVGKPHRGIGFVDMLAAGTAGTIGIDAQLIAIDVDVAHLVGLRQHRHGTGAGVDTALGLGFRHALHPVGAGFEFQLAVDVFARNARDDFLVTAVLAGPFAEYFQAPALVFGVLGVHAQQNRR